MTGLSTSQMTRLIRKKKEKGKVKLSSKKKHTFPVKYGPGGIRLLVKTDNAHNRLSGPHGKRILEREHKIFGNKKYKTVSQISSSHIYNLREKRIYDTYLTPYEKLKSINKAETFLKEGLSFEKLDKKAYRESDNEYALKVKKAERKLFKNLKDVPQGLNCLRYFRKGDFMLIS